MQVLSRLCRKQGKAGYKWQYYLQGIFPYVVENIIIPILIVHEPTLSGA